MTSLIHLKTFISILLVIVSVVLIIISKSNSSVNVSVEKSAERTRYSRTGNKNRKLAHFVYGLWSTEPMRIDYVENINVWKAHGWEIKIWGKNDCDLLISHYPQYIDFYHSLSRPVQKSDFIRCLIVFNEGGFYFDCDTVPLNNQLFLDFEIFDKDQSVFFIESISTKEWNDQTINFQIRNGEKEDLIRIANFSFGSISHSNPIFTTIIDEIIKRVNESTYSNDDIYYVLYTTGPDVFSHIINNVEIGDNVELYLSDSYMLHKETGSWK